MNPKGWLYALTSEECGFNPNRFFFLGLLKIISLVRRFKTCIISNKELLLLFLLLHLICYSTPAERANIFDICSQMLCLWFALWFLYISKRALYVSIRYIQSNQLIKKNFNISYLQKKTWLFQVAFKLQSPKKDATFIILMYIDDFCKHVYCKYVLFVMTPKPSSKIVKWMT